MKNTITSTQRELLITASTGHLYIQTPGWWTSPEFGGGPWTTSTIDRLAAMGYMTREGDHAEITDAGRKAVRIEK